LKACSLSGKSAELKSIAEQVLQIAPTEITVLITGESGVGKELIARAIHNNSPRKSKPFFAVNCAAFAEGILESELFGHEKGAFTGAVARKQGVFEAASGGTIFLDEVGELKPATQVKLLRVLEEKEIMRVGGTERIRVDARVVAATNRDLTLAVQEGGFRRDLYYRLAVIKIEVPPLRERVKDIPILARKFLNQLQEKYSDRQPSISESALDLIARYLWPGNVRELKNFIESGVALSRTGRIETSEVSAYIEKQSRSNRNLPVVTGRSTTEAEHDLIFQALSSLRAEIISLKNLIKEGLEMTVGYPARSEQASETGGEISQESLEELEKEHIHRVLTQVGRNRRKAAKILGIGERTLYRKLKEYGLR
jgi:transcriptional regulator with PAS, ATPase and Fis domain